MLGSKATEGNVITVLSGTSQGVDGQTWMGCIPVPLVSVPTPANEDGIAGPEERRRYVSAALSNAPGRPLSPKGEERTEDLDTRHLRSAEHAGSPKQEALPAWGRGHGLPQGTAGMAGADPVAGPTVEEARGTEAKPVPAGEEA